jgi:hypothetical protein
MRNRIAATIAGLVLAGSVWAVPQALAADCPGEMQKVPVGSFYVVVDKNGDQWIYQESNGKPDLQRGGKGGATGFSGEDACGVKGQKPDTIIY